MSSLEYRTATTAERRVNVAGYFDIPRVPNENFHFVRLRQTVESEKDDFGSVSMRWRFRESFVMSQEKLSFL